MHWTYNLVQFVLATQNNYCDYARVGAVVLSERQCSEMLCPNKQFILEENNRHIFLLYQQCKGHHDSTQLLQQDS